MSLINIVFVYISLQKIKLFSAHGFFLRFLFENHPRIFLRTALADAQSPVFKVLITDE